MAKGQISKQEVTKKILETFKGSFIYDKEIRIPLIEDNEVVQLKCTLTCAKTNVEPNGESQISGMTVKDNNEFNFGEETKPKIEPTQEEKDNIKKLMEALNL